MTTPRKEGVYEAAEIIAKGLVAAFISPNESDTNLEAANVVDALFFIGRGLNRIAVALEKANERPWNST